MTGDLLHPASPRPKGRPRGSRSSPDAKWRRGAIDGTDSLKRNTAQAIRKAERKLCNSMAHVVRPREADYARWRAMETHIAALKASLAKMGAPEKLPRRPLKVKVVAPVGGQAKARFRNTAKPGGNSDATS